MSLTTESICIIIALSALIIGSIGAVLGSLALIKSLALERTTHTIQYMPVDNAIDRENEAFLKSLNSDWATSEQELQKQQEMFKEDLETSMPEFYEEDKEILSF